MADTADGVADALHQAEGARSVADRAPRSLSTAVQPALEPHRRHFPRARQDELNAILDGVADQRSAVAPAVLPEAAWQVGGESDVVARVLVASAEVQQVDRADDQSALAGEGCPFHGVR